MCVTYLSGVSVYVCVCVCVCVSHLEPQLHQVVALECSVCAGHGDDLGLLHQQVFGPVQPATQKLKGPELLRGDQRTVPSSPAHSSSEPV